MSKISVVMSVYNADKYLKESIDSILQQTYTDFEFIIINDGSTDKTDEIINTYLDKRIIYIKNKQNLGLPASLNKGIKLAKGKYIARMDSDDISLPIRFEKQLDYMENNPQCVLLGASVQFFGNKNKIGKITGDSKELFYKYLTGGIMVFHPVAMFRRSIVIENNEFYNEQYTSSQDFDLWNRLKHYGSVENLSEVLLNYRSHEESISSKKIKYQYANKLEIVEKEFKKEFGLEYPNSFKEISLDKKNDCSKQEFYSYMKFHSKIFNKPEKLLLYKKFLRKKIKSKYDILGLIKVFSLSTFYYTFTKRG